MMRFDAGRVDRLITDFMGLLDPAGLWLASACAPGQKAVDPAWADDIREWALAECDTWPAPIGIGQGLVGCDGKRAVFSPADYGRSASGYYCELHADGTAVVAVQIGNLREDGDSQDAVWAVGEGAIAWLTIAMARLAGAWADRLGIASDASFDLRIASTVEASLRPAVQLWNFASGENAPASDPIPIVRPSRKVVNLLPCLSAEATLTARSLLLPLLAQFGQNGSRHIDAAGIVETANFASHAPLICDWARAIGLEYRTAPGVAQQE